MVVVPEPELVLVLVSEPGLVLVPELVLELVLVSEPVLVLAQAPGLAPG